jgi:hypothetical protein
VPSPADKDLALVLRPAGTRCHRADDGAEHRVRRGDLHHRARVDQVFDVIVQGRAASEYAGAGVAVVDERPAIRVDEVAGDVRVEPIQYLHRDAFFLCADVALFAGLLVLVPREFLNCYLDLGGGHSLVIRRFREFADQVDELRAIGAAQLQQSCQFFRLVDRGRVRPYTVFGRQVGAPIGFRGVGLGLALIVAEGIGVIDVLSVAVFAVCPLSLRLAGTVRVGAAGVRFVVVIASLA